MIILTGGAGFIGSCMLAALNEAGRTDVLVVDSLGLGTKWKNLVGTSFIDIIDKNEFRERIAVEAFDDVEAVIHLGACSSTTEPNADYLLDNNYRYSIDVAEFAMECGARFLYASSAATYGNGIQGYDESATGLRPMNMYGYSKLLFDDWVAAQGLRESCVGLRFFNVFGPNEYHKGEMRSMVSKAYDQISKTGRVQLFASNDPAYGDGEQVRDFVYVKDCCAVMLELLKQPHVNGLFNLGSGVATTWNSLVGAVFSAMNHVPNIEYIPMPMHLDGQYQNHTCANMNLLRTALPNVIFYPVAAAVSDYVQQHLASPWPYLRTNS
jgi:ADP-L-glycero-D-manno-heptose 6-epimerase